VNEMNATAVSSKKGREYQRIAISCTLFNRL